MFRTFSSRKIKLYKLTDTVENGTMLRKRIRYKRKYKRTYKSLLTRLLFTAVVVAVVIFAIIKISEGPEKWVGVHSGFISSNTQHKALVMNDEIIYKALNSGSITNPESEGKRVKKGQIIATFVSSGNAESESSDNSDANEPVINAEKVDKTQVKDEITSLYKTLNEALKAGDNAKAKSVKKELIYAIDYLKKINRGENSSNEVYNAFEKLVGSNSAEQGQEFNIIAAESGIISYFIDNLDGKMMFANRYNIDYKKIFEERPYPENVLNNSIFKGDGVLKIIYNLKWHLMCEASMEDLDTFQQDKLLKIQVGAEILEGTVVDKFMAGETGIVAFEINESSDLMTKSRILDVTIIKDEMTGAVIPENSVVTVDGVSGVYVKGVSGEKVFRPIEILGRNKEGLIVSSGSFSYVDDSGEMRTVDTVKNDDSVMIKE